MTETRGEIVSPLVAYFFILNRSFTPDSMSESERTCKTVPCRFLSFLLETRFHSHGKGGGWVVGWGLGGGWWWVGGGEGGGGGGVWLLCPSE